MKRRLSTAAVAIIALAAMGSASVGVPAEITTIQPQKGVGVERGVAVIRCSTDRKKVWRISRGALLDLGVGETDYDVVLTTAHGLADDPNAVPRDCRVLGTRGRALRIEKAWLARGDESDAAHDWAVLLTKGRMTGRVNRLRAGQFTPEAMLKLTAEEAPLRLLLRSADVRQGDCNLRAVRGGVPDFRSSGLMYYSCQTAPGLSGSPILAGVDGDALLIGIHLGWTLEPTASTRMRLVTVGRPIDAEIAAAISAAASYALQR